MTITEQKEGKGLPTGLVILSAAVAGLGGLMFGFDTAVISGAEGALEDYFKLDSFGLGLLVAMATVGTIVGAAIAGTLSDRFGRKPVLLFIGALYVAGALGTALASLQWVFLLFRFIGGVGVGMSSVVAPIYTAEIAPPRHRGVLVGLVQLNVCLGMTVAYVSNMVINAAMDADVAWRWMLGVMAVPSVIFLALLLLVPETPRWLMSHGRDEKAVSVSRRLCSTQAESDNQLEEIRSQISADAALAASAARTPFFTAKNRKVILLAFCIAMFNQLSGVNAILYYAPRIIQNAGASSSASYTMTVGVGVTMFIMTGVALTAIDRLGRRRIMLIGTIGYLVSLGFLSIIMFMYEGHFDQFSANLVLVGLLVFIAGHAFGQGSIIWVFISEIFPNRIRGRGQSLGSMTHWTFAAIITYAFPSLIDLLGGGISFAFFFVCMLGQLYWVLRVMPETKGVPLEEMEARLGMTAEPVNE